MTYEYIVPVTLTPESNNSYVNKRTLLIKDCTTPVEELLASTWNFNLCGQDECYFQPYVSGDIIYRQHIVTNISFQAAFIVLYDAVTNEPFNYDIAPVIGQDADLNRYLNVQIDPTDFENRCFYYGLHFFTCTPSGLILALCIASKIAGEGLSYQHAALECYQTLCPDEEPFTIYSEPFEEVKCRNSVLVEGEYPTYDCNGNYYGPFLSGPNTHKVSFRVYGEVDQQDYGFTAVFQNNAKKSTKKQETWLFRTPKIPPYVANMLAVAWNSKVLTIDYVEYKEATEINKNNEDGKMWIVESTLTRDCDEITFTCS